jgi:hypothetical protein
MRISVVALSVHIPQTEHLNISLCVIFKPDSHEWANVIG